MADTKATLSVLTLSGAGPKAKLHKVQAPQLAHLSTPLVPPLPHVSTPQGDTDHRLLTSSLPYTCSPAFQRQPHTMHVALGSPYKLSTEPMLPPVEERNSWGAWVSKALTGKKTMGRKLTVSPGTEGRNVAGSQQLLLSSVYESLWPSHSQHPVESVSISLICIYFP